MQMAAPPVHPGAPMVDRGFTGPGGAAGGARRRLASKLFERQHSLQDPSFDPVSQRFGRDEVTTLAALSHHDSSSDLAYEARFCCRLVSCGNTCDLDATRRVHGHGSYALGSCLAMSCSCPTLLAVGPWPCQQYLPACVVNPMPQHAPIACLSEADPHSCC